MILYRPVGHKELEFIFDAGLRKFPPRLHEQPIFYPVTNAGYAREIAERWNTKNNSHAGYITRFNVENDYSQKFQKQVVGGKKYEELWVPAEELDEFNSKIIGHIDVIAAYFGDEFIGSLPEKGFSNIEAGASEYLQRLVNTSNYSTMDFMGAILMNPKSIYCNYAYWKQYDFNLITSDETNKAEKIIPAMAEIWHRNYPGIKLPTEAEIFEYEREHLA